MKLSRCYKCKHGYIDGGLWVWCELPMNKKPKYIRCMKGFKGCKYYKRWRINELIEF